MTTNDPHAPQTALDVAARLIDAHQFSRVHGGTLGEQIADAIDDEGLFVSRHSPIPACPACGVRFAHVVANYLPPISIRHCGQCGHEWVEEDISREQAPTGGRE